MEGIMEEFIMILLELVKLLDRLLDLDEQQLDVCTRAKYKYITDFRNFIAMFANRLQRRDDKKQPQPKEQPDCSLKAYFFLIQ